MNTRIANIGQLVTPSPARTSLDPSTVVNVRERTELWIRDGRITAVGRVSRGERAEQEIDADGGVVLPGLIDAHTHFGPAGETNGGASPSGDSLESARRTVRARLRRALRSGVTTVEVKCSSLSELVELASIGRTDAAQLPQVVATLFGAPPPPATEHAERMAELIGDAIPTVRRQRLAQFCDVACGDGAYGPEEARTILRAARAAGLHLKLHSQDGRSGTLRALAAKLEISAIGHLTALDDRDAAEWKRVGVLPILLPGDGLVGGRPYPVARGFVDAGLAIGLGTDAGAGSVAAGSMWLAIALAVSAMGMSMESAITAATSHNAYALEAATEIGTVDVGKRADLLILDIADYRELMGELGEEPIRAVLRDGELVHQR